MHTSVSLANLMIAALLIGQPPAAGGMKGDREVLKLAAATHQANHERIETWKGRARVFHYQEPVGREVHSTVDFVLDRNRQALRWKWTYDSFVKPFDADILGEVVNMMFRDGKYYTMTTGYKPGTRQPVKKWLSIGHADVFRGRWHAQGFFDPMYHFNHPGTEHTFESMFRNYYNGFDHPLANGSVTREGDVLTIELAAPNVSQRYRFDLARGANLIELHSEESGSQIDDYTATWEEIDGIWLPKTWSRSNVITHDSQFRKRGEASGRRVEWISHVVNKPIDENEFSYEALGLKPGEEIRDGSSGTKSILSGNGRTANDATGGQRDAVKSSRMRWILGGNAVLVGILAGVGYYRWRRKSSSARTSCA